MNEKAAPETKRIVEQEAGISDLTNPPAGGPLGSLECCGILGRVVGGFRLAVREFDKPVPEVPVLDGPGGAEPVLVLLGVHPRVIWRSRDWTSFPFQVLTPGWGPFRLGRVIPWGA